jgi:hypothetical protein
VASILLTVQTEATKTSYFFYLPEDRFDDRFAQDPMKLNLTTSNELAERRKGYSSEPS